MFIRQRIAVVAPRFPGGSAAGGAETLLGVLAHRMVARGHDVRFLTTCARDHFTWKNEIEPGTRESDGLPVTFFPVDQDRDVTEFLRAQARISRGRTSNEADGSTWLDNSVHSSALYEHLAGETASYDRIVAGPYLYGMIHRIASLHAEKTILVPCLHDEPFAALPAIRRMFRDVRLCMFNTEPERELAVRLYDLPPTSTRVVGMGIDAFDVDSIRPAPLSNVDRYVLYSGRREEGKGTTLLVDYFRVFLDRTGLDLTLVFTGSGDLPARAVSADWVIDLGFVSETDKHRAMAGATVFCHPSPNESLGIVLLESWLAGTPVLVTARSPVSRDHCARGRGGLWFRTYPEFEEALLFLLDRADARAALASAGRQYVLQQYSWEAVEPRLLEALSA